MEPRFSEVPMDWANWFAISSVCYIEVELIIDGSNKREKIEQTRNFQKFASDDGNESLQSPSPPLTGFNMQASVTKIVTSESRESP